MDIARTIEAKYLALAGRIDEATLRLWVATEARSLGRGGVSVVAKAAGVSRTTVYAGLAELDAGSAQRRSLRNWVVGARLEALHVNQVTLPVSRRELGRADHFDGCNQLSRYAIATLRATNGSNDAATNRARGTSGEALHAALTIGFSVDAVHGFVLQRPIGYWEKTSIQTIALHTMSDETKGVRVAGI